MDAKKWFKSKTLWWNAIWLVVAVAAAFGYADFVPGEDTKQIAMVVVTIINLALRAVTKQPIGK